MARGILKDGLDSGTLLDHHRQRQRTETRSGLSIRNDHRVNALDAQTARLLDRVVTGVASRWHELHERDPAPADQRVGQIRLLRSIDRRDRRRGREYTGLPARSFGRRIAADGRLDLANVIRRGPAAAADET